MCRKGHRPNMQRHVTFRPELDLAVDGARHGGACAAGHLGGAVYRFGGRIGQVRVDDVEAGHAAGHGRGGSPRGDAPGQGAPCGDGSRAEGAHHGGGQVGEAGLAVGGLQGELGADGSVAQAEVSDGARAVPRHAGSGESQSCASP